ncbi:MAG: SusD/RagB family nutrient-binding outer membrane lipoprotein [Ginsengibacter sp.]
MKHINKRIIFNVAFILILWGFSSCKKTFLDVNTDPNRVTDANITAELIFPQAANAVGAIVPNNFSFLDQWVGYWAPNGGFVPQQNLISYNIDFSFADGLFKNYYNALFDLHQTEIKGIAKGDTDLAAASIVLSAKLYQELVDLYGDVPYSQAFQDDKYTSPIYDKAQDIYNSLQNQLDTAINYFNNTSPTSSFAKADIINHGNVQMWIKFANTLKLRLLIRQSNVSSSPSAEIAKIQSNGGVLGAGESISVNPGYSNDVNKQNPFYANEGWTPTGTQTDLALDANIYIVNILANTGDPRIARLFFPAGFDATKGFVGNVFGDPIGTLALANVSSYFGPALNGALNSSDVGMGFSNDQFIYPSYESMFLYAEAVARGWIADDANTALKAAITESFVWLGVPNAATAASAYITANSKIATIIPDSSLTVKVNTIAYQKYIANTGVDPLESFLDINRLHFLKDNSYISTLSGKASSFLPFRLLYAQSEYTTNAANTPKEVASDVFSKKLFWQP